MDSSAIRGGKSILREILGLDSKFAIYNLIVRNLKLRYRKSLLGILWTTFIPAFNALVFFFAFKFVFRAQVPHYLLVIITGVTCWGFFNQAILSGLESIVSHHGILNKVPVAPSIFPFADVIGAFINLTLSLPVVMAVSYVDGNGLSLTWFIAIAWLILLFIQAYFLAIVFSVTFIFFRDLRHVSVIALQGWFYLTPIVYHASMVPEDYYIVKYINPIWLIFRNIQSLVTNEIPVTMGTDFLFASLWTLVIICLGFKVYSSQRNRIVENL